LCHLRIVEPENKAKNDDIPVDRAEAQNGSTALLDVHIGCGSNFRRVSGSGSRNEPEDLFGSLIPSELVDAQIASDG
jgi:hypothetical protein